LNLPAFRAHRRAHTPPPAGSLSTGPQRQRSAGRKQGACQTGGAPRRRTGARRAARDHWRCCPPGRAAVLSRVNPCPLLWAMPPSLGPQGGSRARVRPEEHRDDGLARDVPPGIIDDVANHKPQSQTPSGFSAYFPAIQDLWW